jgi:hypothetical protein
MFEIFESVPSVARDFREIAAKRGVPFDLLVYEAIARGCYKNHRPLPPEARDYLLRHATKIDPKLRAKLLKPLIN